MKKRLHHARVIGLVLVFIILIIYISRSTLIQHYISQPETLRDILLQWGVFAPVAVILLHLVLAMLPLIPSQLISVAAGFTFGPWLGLLYSLLGSVLGSLLVFVVAQKKGKAVAEHFFEKRDLVHFHHLFRRHRLWALFIARVATILPGDVVSFAAGLTRMSWRSFVVVSTLGYTLHLFILTYFGAQLVEGVIQSSLIIGTTIVGILIVLVLFRNKIKERLITDFHKIENQVETEFQKI